MVFQGRLDLVKTTVDEGLAAFFIKKKQKAKKISPHCMMLVDQVAELTTRGGKRTRAFLCWLGYKAARESKIPKHLLSAMMGLELFQSFALIHDDIIDEDAVRRGGPTVHEYFKVESLKFKVKNAKHFGESMAILAGDLALVWADELMLNVKDSFVIYQKMKEEVMYGQTLDVMEEYVKPGIPKELIDTYKTAWYSVIRPLQIGAALGGASEKTIEAFVPYGLAVGEAYQLRDDVLDGDIQNDTLQSHASKLQEQAVQAIKKLKISKSVTMLLADFAHFALHRSA